MVFPDGTVSENITIELVVILITCTFIPRIRYKCTKAVGFFIPVWQSCTIAITGAPSFVPPKLTNWTYFIVLLGRQMQIAISVESSVPQILELGGG